MPRGGYRGGVKPTLPDELKKKAVTFRIKPGLLTKLGSDAKDLGISKTRLIEQLIRDFKLEGDKPFQGEYRPMPNLRSLSTGDEFGIIFNFDLKN